MTFNEFIGITCGNIDVETKKTMEHRDIYKRAVERFGGIEIIKSLIPFTLKEIRNALNEGDVYLNSLDIKEWDRSAGFYCNNSVCNPIYSSPIWKMYKSHGVTSMSCSQGVSLLKEAAKMWAESNE